MKVTQLYVYPIKSFQGISLKSSKLTDRGLKYDRRWLLVDEENLQITQRENQQLAKFKPTLKEWGIDVLNQENGKSCFVPFTFENTKKEQVKVWDDEFEALEVNQDLSKWFSDALQKTVKLMYMPDDALRYTDTKYTSNNEIVSAADGYPILIISEESLAELNSKLEEPVSMNRFRPNIVISGVSTSHAEDELIHTMIGSSVLLGVKNCSRCVMITNKPDGSPRTKEPLKTLASYRLKDKKVLFGRNFVVAKKGKIKIGDPVSVL